MDEENKNNLNQPKTEEEPVNIQNQLTELTETDMLSSKIVELENNMNLYKEQVLRKAAEFENYKKRVENETGNIIRYANEDLIEKFLPVVDDFDRSLVALRNTNSDNLIKGIELIYNKFKKILELQGVRPMDVVGQPFDPEFHDALLQMPSSDFPPNTILQEVEKGYLLHDKVLRHAKVVVSSCLNNSEGSPNNNLSETD